MSGVLVHEWISRAGGSEKVFDRLVHAFPAADVLCLWNDDPGRYAARPVRESWIARTPLRHHKALALPFMTAAWRHTPTRRSYDWALVSSHAFAHHFRPTRRGARLAKYVYVHTPARYIWSPELDRRGSGLAARAAAPALRTLDRRLAAEPVEVAANSAFVRDRIRAAWDRDARVIHPPVDVARIQAVADWRTALDDDDLRTVEALPPTYLLGASRFVGYKRLDLVITAGEAVGLPVVLAGSGPDRALLAERAATASVPVTLVDRPSDALLFALYQRALVFVFPPVEDFGIMPVEAMACGTPVVVNAVGGAVESAQVPLGGASFADDSAEALADAVRRAAAVDRRAVAVHARSFSHETFDRAIAEWVPFA